MDCCQYGAGTRLPQQMNGIIYNVTEDGDYKKSKSSGNHQREFVFYFVHLLCVLTYYLSISFDFCFVFDVFIFLLASRTFVRGSDGNNSGFYLFCAFVS